MARLPVHRPCLRDDGLNTLHHRVRDNLAQIEVEPGIPGLNAHKRDAGWQNPE